MWVLCIQNVPNPTDVMRQQCSRLNKLYPQLYILKANQFDHFIWDFIIFSRAGKELDKCRDTIRVKLAVGHSNKFNEYHGSIDLPDYPLHHGVHSWRGAKHTYNGVPSSCIVGALFEWSNYIASFMTLGSSQNVVLARTKKLDVMYDAPDPFVK